MDEKFEILIDSEWGQNPKRVGPVDKEWEKRFDQHLLVSGKAKQDLIWLRRRAEIKGYRWDFVDHAIRRGVERYVRREGKFQRGSLDKVKNDIHVSRSLIASAKQFLKLLPEHQHQSPRRIDEDLRFASTLGRGKRSKPWLVARNDHSMERWKSSEVLSILTT